MKFLKGVMYMRFKKLTALALSMVIAAGVCGVIPTSTDFDAISVTASAASDFTIKTDSDGLKYISKYTGSGGNIKIPDGVDYVGKNVFEKNKNVSSVTFPESCFMVEENAFYLCTKLRKVVFEGDVCICANAFEKCVSLESVTINGSILAGISGGAFRDCQALASVKIKEDKNEFWIGAYAFYNCYSLIKMNIPSKCTEIFTCAFMNCFSLTDLTIPAKTKISDNYDEEIVQNKQFGYVQLFPTEDDCLAYIEGEDDYALNTVLAGGKAGYSEKFTRYPGTSYQFYYEAAQYSPKAITLTVTKGSPAEEWAKENKVKYKYASSSGSSGTTGSSSSDSLAAPTGIKASKTSSSVTLSWNSVAGADAYRVYMYDDSTGEYEQYKDVSGTKCTVSGLKSGKTYKFKIAALEETGGKYKAGKRSKAVSVKTK